MMREKIIFMRNKPRWEELYGKKNRYGVKPCALAKIALERMKKNKVGKILDLGSGEGKDGIFFAKNGYEVFCLDFSEKAIGSCKENAESAGVENLVHPLLEDISKPFKFEDGEFDAVFAHLSLHYFDDATTTKIFDEIHRVLKMGGLFFANVKSVNDPLYGKGKKIDEDTYELGHVRHFFSEAYLLEKSKRFEIVSVRELEDESEYAKKEVSGRSVFLEMIARKTD